MNRVEEMMLPPPPSSPFWKEHEDARRKDQLAVVSEGISPFRASLAAKEKEHMMKSRTKRMTTEYEADLRNLLGKSRGTPYEKTLRRFIEGRESHVIDEHELSMSIGEITDDYQPTSSSTPCSSIIRASQSLIGESPSRKMAREDVDKLVKRKEKVILDTAREDKKYNTVHKGRENFHNDKEWLDKIAAPRKDHTWAHELEKRREGHTVRNSTNHIGRQRPAPNVSSVDMVAHTAVGVVNLADLYNKEAIARGIQKGLKMDPYQSLVTQMVSEKRGISIDDFSLWLEKTQLWRHHITEKVAEAEKRTKNEVYPGEPHIRSHSKAIASRGLRREGARLAQEMIEMDNDINLRHSGIHAFSRGQRVGDSSDSPANESEIDRSSPAHEFQSSHDAEGLKIRLKDLESKREEYFGEGSHRQQLQSDNAKEHATAGVMGSCASTSRDDKVVQTANKEGITFSQVGPDADLATFEQAEEDYQEKEAMRKYREMADRVACAPTVFDRMSAR